MAKVIKVKQGERITPENIQKAIALLEAGGTKKSACDTLGIRYNTTRLQTIIDEFSRREANEKRLRDKKKGTPVDKVEAISIIESYLEEGSVEAVSKMFFRPTYIINKVLDHYGARLFNTDSTPLKPALLPDLCVSDSFEVGEYVWVSGYNALGEVKWKARNPEDCYCVWVLGSRARFTNEMNYNLGSLKHLQELGLDFKKVRFFERQRRDNNDDE
jgi:hypothetical protein